jgi:hypothetical protein
VDPVAVSLICQSKSEHIIRDDDIADVDGRTLTKKAAVREERTVLLLLGRILPLKISTEVKQDKEIMTIDEAVADLKALGMEPLLAMYLKRYPIERDDGDPEWARTIDLTLADRPIEELMSLKENDTENDIE